MLGLIIQEIQNLVKSNASQNDNRKSLASLQSKLNQIEIPKLCAGQPIDFYLWYFLSV